MFKPFHQIDNVVSGHRCIGGRLEQFVAGQIGDRADRLQAGVTGGDDGHDRTTALPTFEIQQMGISALSHHPGFQRMISRLAHGTGREDPEVTAVAARRGDRVVVHGCEVQRGRSITRTEHSVKNTHVYV